MKSNAEKVKAKAQKEKERGIKIVGGVIYDSPEIREKVRKRMARTEEDVEKEIDAMFLEMSVGWVRKSGPTRVVINKEGEAIPPDRAEEEHGITPDVIFIRDDGWSLGAPSHLRLVAEEMWVNDWVAIMERPFEKANCYKNQRRP